MKHFLKNLITCGFSFAILHGTLHVDFHNHDSFDGFSICNYGCDDERHHLLSHECEKCLNKNNKLINTQVGDFQYNQPKILFYSSSKKRYNNYFYYSLYSRPPPNLSKC